MSGLLPRDRTKLDPHVKCHSTLCDAHAVYFVDHYNGALFASGDLADSYFHGDKVHHILDGIKKLLRRNIYASIREHVQVLIFSRLSQDTDRGC